jgi:hypothetical protein
LNNEIGDIELIPKSGSKAYVKDSVGTSREIWHTGNFNPDASLTVYKDGVSIGSRGKLNFSGSPSISLSVTDDAENGDIDVNISAMIKTNMTSTEVLYTAGTDGETAIVIPITDYDVTKGVTHIYFNAEQRLFKDVHYTMGLDNKSIVLSDWSLNKGETLMFEQIYPV